MYFSEESDLMAEKDKKVLVNNTVYLLENLEIEYGLLNYLQEPYDIGGVDYYAISQLDAERIKCYRNQPDKRSEVLELIKRGHESAFAKFMNALLSSNQRHIAYKLDPVNGMFLIEIMM